MLTIETFIVGPMPNNLYLLHDAAAREAVVIDPSIDSEAARERVRELHKDGTRLVAAWNTHGHFDHIYDNAKWRAEFGMPILMNSADNYFLEHLREQALWFGMEAPDLAPPDGELSDGQILRLGDYRVRVLSTPGHSPGSVSFLLDEGMDAPLCISGDVLFPGSAGRTDLPMCSRDDLNASLRRLMELPDTTRILPGHYASTTIGHERATNPHCLTALRKTS